MRIALVSPHINASFCCCCMFLVVASRSCHSFGFWQLFSTVYAVRCGFLFTFLLMRCRSRRLMPKSIDQVVICEYERFQVLTTMASLYVQIHCVVMKILSAVAYSHFTAQYLVSNAVKRAIKFIDWICTQWYQKKQLIKSGYQWIW